MPPKLERESADAYARFCAYAVPAEGEARTFASVARQFELNPTTVEEMAKRFEWRKRVIAFERAKVETQAVRAGELASEAGRDALALCRTLRDQIANIVASIDDNTAPEDVLQCGLDASKILERLVKIERLILGLSTENQSVIIKDDRRRLPDLRNLSDAEVRALEWHEDFGELIGQKLKGERHDATKLAVLVAKVAA